MKNEFRCLRCGRCWIEAGPTLHVAQNDVERWKAERRKDILSKLWLNQLVCRECDIEWPPWEGKKCPECGKHPTDAVYYWLDPRSPMTVFSQLLANPRCPFLRKVRKKDEYLCIIHETKPDICRDFPELEESKVTDNEEECIEWGCKGYRAWKKKVKKQSAR
jgi:Fe-S-cluster containining protein